ncbi:MAG: hypothetical protein ABIA78_02935 [archaeon]
MKKGNIITITILLGVIIISFLILNQNPNTDEETAKCIGENSILYVQLGCHACEIQKDMFGDNYKHLTIVDCFYERGKCLEIQSTPTWIIKGQKYTGVQSIEKLKELTGC